MEDAEMEDAEMEDAEMVSAEMVRTEVVERWGLARPFHGYREPIQPFLEEIAR